MKRKTEYRIGRERIGREEMEGMLRALLDRKYIELSDVERKLLGVLMRWFEVELKCPNCSKWFRPNRIDQRFCSSRCRINYDSRLIHREQRMKKRG